MSDLYSIPRYLDEPFRLILWTGDECLVFLIPFILLTVGCNSPLMGILLGGSLMLGLKKLKGEQGHYFLHHVMYWYLPALIRFHCTPSSHIREFIG